MLNAPKRLANTAQHIEGFWLSLVGPMQSPDFPGRARCDDAAGRIYAGFQPLRGTDLQSRKIRLGCYKCGGDKPSCYGTSTRGYGWRRGQMRDARRSPIIAENPEGRGLLVIVCDHASNRIPEDYKSFGFAEDALRTHIAWDPGALQVARRLSARFDAPLFWPDISRLVIDCNRAPDASSLIVAESEGRKVEANRGLTEDERARRLDHIHRPYHAAIDSCSCAARCGGTADNADRGPLLHPDISWQV